MSRFCFYELPVYRVSENSYYIARNTFIEEKIFHSSDPEGAFKRDFYKRNPYQEAVFRDHLEKVYGGCWRFNEIIGHIRLHFLGSQVRGEYYSVSRRRIIRTRKKLFEFQTWKFAPEIDIEPPYGDPEILGAIREYIENCKREVPKRFIDTSTFDAVAEVIDWVALLRSSR